MSSSLSHQSSQPSQYPQSSSHTSTPASVLFSPLYDSMFLRLNLYPRSHLVRSNFGLMNLIADIITIGTNMSNNITAEEAHLLRQISEAIKEELKSSA